MTDYSQNGESKILKVLFDTIGISKGTYLDIGAGDGYEFSNTAYFRQLGWTGIEVDADPGGSTFVKQMKITEENCYQLAGNYNLLSIDIDGNDYWILRKFLSMLALPDVIIFEINSQLPFGQSVAMPYNAEHDWDGSNYFGMSYLAGINLCFEFEYKVYAVVNSQNVIAVHRRHYVLPLKITLHQSLSHPETTKQFQEV